MVTPRYKKYLKSKKWQAKRQEVFRHYGKKCYICKTTRGTIQVHHRSYQSIFNEKIEHLIPVCIKCHDRITKFHRRNRRAGIERNTAYMIKVIRKQMGMSQ